MTDGAALSGFFARAARRITLIASAEGAAAGLILAVPFILVFSIAWPGVIDTPGAAGIALLFAVGGAVVRAVQTRMQQTAVAVRIERNAPQCRNLLVTAAEILRDEVRVTPSIGGLVCREAARVAAKLDPALLFPARRVALVLASAIVLSALAIANVRAAPRREAVSAPDESVPAIGAVEVIVVPPDYSGLGEASRQDPVRVEVLEGSRVQVRIRAQAATVTMETPDEERELSPAQPGQFTAELIVRADGYIALEPRSSAGEPGARRLIGISVRSDEAPRVRVTLPGHDLFLSEATRPLDIAVEAHDDLALSSLQLRYTLVSGSGEQFTFTDGEMPLAVERTDARSWVGRATVRLDTLGLQAGDVFVYRGIAADRRPGGAVVESDAFLVEITSPGAVASEGFAMDDEEDRYALSQQMVILKTERLITRSASAHPDSVLLEARALAAEQRSVRAEFVFMMGGELAEEVEEANIGDLNEEEHVEADDEAIAGRLENQGRFALIRAIRSMSRAYAMLNEGDLATALNEEKRALDFLLGAFARTRYILRALTEREQIDLARRLTGALDEAARDARPFAAVPESEQIAILRAALSEVSSLVAAERSGAERATLLAQRLLRADPSSSETQEIAGALLEAAAELRRARTEDALQHLDRAATLISERLRTQLPASPANDGSFRIDQLDGALTDALRRGGR